MDAMRFFATHYEKRGIVFDEIYAWEAKAQPPDAYWEGTPAALRKRWAPRLTFYNGIPITNETGHEHNPVDRIRRLCKAEDFCAFKLDIDAPPIELSIAQQLLAPEASAVLDEFFFEHHVQGLMQQYGWKSNIPGTYADSARL